MNTYCGTGLANPRNPRGLTLAWDHNVYVAHGDHNLMANWKTIGVVAEGQPIRIGTLNVWDYDWHPAELAAIELPHPSHPSQLHRVSIYKITDGKSTETFAAGELSMNVWGFYEPN